MSSITLNTIGLLLDIVGVLLLLFFWVAPQTAFKGQLATSAEEYSEKNRKKLGRMKLLARLGMWLIILGFLLQALSNYRP
ncbi:MAG: hypothetical protein JRJ65_13330 [Deltaproteobacteria bacterium]|nr:hypothetical protein [Deltaproteobacteria bacterium]